MYSSDLPQTMWLAINEWGLHILKPGEKVCTMVTVWWTHRGCQLNAHILNPLPRPLAITDTDCVALVRQRHQLQPVRSQLDDCRRELDAWYQIRV